MTSSARGLVLGRWQRERGPRKQVPLRETNPRVPQRRELVGALDTFGDHVGLKAAAQLHQARDELLLPRVAMDPRDELAVELHDLGSEIDDALQVGDTRAKIVDHEGNPASGAELAKDVEAEVEVRDRNRFRDLDERLVIVGEDRVVGADDPALVELLRVHVEEESLTATERDCDLANQASEAARTARGDRLLEEDEWVPIFGDATANERLVAEDCAGIQAHDGLKYDGQVLGAHHAGERTLGVVSRLAPVFRRRRIGETVGRWKRGAHGGSSQSNTYMEAPVNGSSCIFSHMRTTAMLVLIGCALFSSGCDGDKKKSLAQAAEHTKTLADVVKADVEEVRNGLPKGTPFLAKLYEGDKAPKDDLKAVRDALETARNKTQDLRVAKSTFFALVDEQGVVVRNDQEQDQMVGKNLFTSYPGLKDALGGKYVEARGSMPEAARVKGPDGQWVAAAPVSVGDKVRGLYVTGWSWSAYAYRLETSLRSTVKSGLKSETEKMPLVYVYVVVENAAYGAPVSPEVNAKAIADQKPLSKISGDDGSTETNLEIEGRDFGLSVRKTPLLGKDVGVAVLRSET